MEKAMIIGASGGIGGAMAKTLAARGVAVTGLSRSGQGLDITDEASVAEHLGALTGPFDFVFVATGKLDGAGAAPEKRLKDVSAEAMADQFATNCIGPSLVMKHAVPLLPKERRAVLAVLTARVGSIGDNAMGGWYSYRTAKAAANAMVHGVGVELSRSHKQAICVALHPGTVATEFTANYQGSHKTVPPEEAARNLLSVVDGLTVADTGQFYDWKGERVPW